MKPARIALSSAFLLFAGVLAHVSGTAPLLLAQTADCNENNTGAQCGHREKCIDSRLSGVEGNTSGGGISTECSETINIYFYRYVDPAPVEGCNAANSYCGWRGSGAGGSWGGGSGGGTPGDGTDCGDPDLWSDNGANCDENQAH